MQRTKNVECQHHRNKNILLKKAHIWLVHLLPRCVWSKPSVFKLVLKRHKTKNKKDEKCHCQWQKLATEMSILKCIWPGRAKRACGCRQPDCSQRSIFFIFVNTMSTLIFNFKIIIKTIVILILMSTSILVWVVLQSHSTSFLETT